jgi:hypothetical protein
MTSLAAERRISCPSSGGAARSGPPVTRSESREEAGGDGDHQRAAYHGASSAGVDHGDIGADNHISCGVMCGENLLTGHPRGKLRGIEEALENGPRFSSGRYGPFARMGRR